MALALAALAAALSASGCGSSAPKLAQPPKVMNFQMRSKLMSREVSDVLVSPAEWTKGRWLLNAADFECHDPIRLARKRSPYDAPVWIDVGDQDQLRPASARLARELRADGANVSFHIWPGSRNGRYWDAHFANYLRFYAHACS